jgi:phosphoribosylamine--glycine ligase
VRFAIVSTYGCDLSIAARLQDEGHEVKYFVDKGKGRERSEAHTHVGEGLVPCEQDFAALTDWAAESMDSLVFFTGSSLGDKAEDLRDRGLLVVGAGSFCDRLELDRGFGQGIAEEAGAQLPPYQEFSSLSDVKKYAKSLDKTVFFKTDRFITSDTTHQCDDGDALVAFINHLREEGVRDATRCILQEKIEGIPISTARWWNGRTFVGPYETTIEHKALMNDDVGPTTGCSINAVWFSDVNKVAESLGWDNLAIRFREENAPPCLYDINAVVDEGGQAWFLEWTPRCGFDSEPTSFRLIDDLGGWLWYVGSGQGGAEFSSDLALATRIGILPYPYEHVEWTDKHQATGTRIFGTDGLWAGNFIAYQVRKSPEEGLELASPEGVVGLSLAVGDDVESLNEEIVEFAREMKPKGLMFRTDADKALGKDAAELRKAGIPMHEAFK